MSNIWKYLKESGKLIGSSLIIHHNNANAIKTHWDRKTQMKHYQSWIGLFKARHQHYWSSVGPKGRADILMSLKPGELFQNSAERKLQESTTAASHPGRRRPTDLRKERKWTSLNFSSKNKSVPFGGGCWRWVWRKAWVITIAEY